MKQRLLLAGLMTLILGAILLAYSNHFHNDFHFDDSHTINNNGYIRNLKNIPLFFKDVGTFSTNPLNQSYRPVVTTTLAIDYWLSAKTDAKHDGYNTFWYHVSNFSWFLMIVLLLYFFQKAVFRNAFRKELLPYFALLGCLWYGLTTANAETVNYIISRSDILSTLAIVASFVIYVVFPHQRKYFFYLIPAAIGSFAKETTIMFAPALIAYHYMIEQQKSLPALFTAEGFKGLLLSIRGGFAALLVCIGMAAFANSMLTTYTPGGTSVLHYAITQPYILLHYITQFFFPFGLSADTDFTLISSPSDDRLFIGFAFLAALLYLIFQTSADSKWRPFSFGLVWFLLMLLPTSSIIPLTEVTNDHRAFLPYIGLLISSITIVYNLYNYKWSQKPVQQYGLLLVLLLVISGYGFGVYQRNKVWHTEESLWKDVTEKSPNNGRGWMNYGLTQMEKGNYTDAESSFLKALEKSPYYATLHINLAILKNAQGKTAEAENYFKNALNYGANTVAPYYYYSRFLYQQGRLQEAEIYCQKALAIFPPHLDSQHLLLSIYQAQNNYSKLLSAAQATLALYPTDATAKEYLAIAQNPSLQTAARTSSNLSAADLINQSLAYYNAGRYPECIDACFRALRIDSLSPEAYNNICSSYNQLGKYDSAIWACTKAIALKPDFERARNNLNWAKSQQQRK